MKKSTLIVITIIFLFTLFGFLMSGIILYRDVVVARLDIVSNEISDVYATTEYRVIHDDLEKLKKEIESYLNNKKGSWSVYIKNLNTDVSFSINNTELKPASVIKLFNMAAFYNSVNNGELQLTEKNLELIKNMITVSSNSASNSVVKLIGNGNFRNGADKVTEFASNLGCSNTTEQHMLFDVTPAVVQGGKNRTTVEDCGLLLEKIYKNSCVNEEYSKAMLDTLLNQTVRTKIPAGLPEGTKCANKTGETGKIQADVGIVFSPKCDYIICVIENSDTTKSGMTGIKDISEMTYNYFNIQK